MSANIDTLLSELIDRPSGSAAQVSGVPSLAPPTISPPARSAFAGLVKPVDEARIAKMSYSHQAMADLIIANPMMSQNELATYFGYSAAWVSRIMGSDAWQAYMAERTKDLVDPTIRATIEERFKGIIYRSLEILEHKLDHPPGDIPDNLALRTAELATKALGYGARPQTVVQINMEQHLEDLGGRLTHLLDRKKAEVGITVEGQLVEDTGD